MSRRYGTLSADDSIEIRLTALEGTALEGTSADDSIETRLTALEGTGSGTTVASGTATDELVKKQTDTEVKGSGIIATEDVTTLSGSILDSTHNLTFSVGGGSVMLLGKIQNFMDYTSAIVRRYRQRLIPNSNSGLNANQKCVTVQGFSNTNDVTVGINNDTPLYALDVNGDLNVTGSVLVSDVSGMSGQVLTSAGAGASPTWSNVDAARIADGSVNNTEFQYLNGVTSSIQSQFTQGTTFGNSYSGSGSQFFGTSIEISNGSGDAGFTNISGNSVRIHTSLDGGTRAERVRVTDVGNVNCSNTTKTVWDSFGTGGYHQSCQIGVAHAHSRTFLRLEGNGILLYSHLDPNGNREWIDSNAPVYSSERFQTAGGFNSNNYNSSDGRIKSREQPITNALETIKLVTGKKYEYHPTHLVDYDDENSDLSGVEHSTKTGVIAQELLDVPELSHLVSSIEMPTITGERIYSVCYEGLIPYLIESIKQLATRVEALEHD